MTMPTYQFDPDFASTSDYARLYRSCGLQAVPAYEPGEQKSWKRPCLASWKEFEGSLVSDDIFNSWFGPDGNHTYKPNLGIITGAASGGAFIVDIDSHTHPESLEWLVRLLEEHNGSESLLCPVQRTGGGGFQYLLRAPDGWVSPTIKTPVGIDIRGEGGFAVMPPSRHESGGVYTWLRHPSAVEIPVAPRWLCDAIDTLAKQYGRGTQQAGTSTPSPTHSTNAFGALIDGREDYMTRLVWARVVALRRESPFLPDGDTMQGHIRDSFTQYERAVKSRIVDGSTPNHVLLERENRGHTMFVEKWRAAVRLWEGKVAEAAGTANPNGRDPRTSQGATGQDTGATDTDDEWRAVADVYELLSEAEIMALPDPVFLIDGIVLSQSLGYIYGNPGAGKSFVALSMALCIATDRETWWDRKIRSHGPVLMIASEGVSDMKFRIQAWRKHHGVDAPSDLFLIRETINFLDVLDKDKLFRTVEALVERAGGLRPAMVVVDTLSRSIPGGDENDQASASLMVQACDALKERWQTTVLCVHHSSKAGSMRGSTVFSGAGDFILEVTREEAAQAGVLTAKKIKAAADGWHQGFNLLKINLGGLEKPVESLVALPALVPALETDEWPERARIKLVLDAVRQAWADGRPWSPYKQAKRTGTYIVANMGRWNITEEHAEKLLGSWMTNRVLSYEVFDPKTKQKGLKVVGGEAGGEGGEAHGYRRVGSDFDE